MQTGYIKVACKDQLFKEMIFSGGKKDSKFWFTISHIKHLITNKSGFLYETNYPMRQSKNIPNYIDQ